MSESNIYYPFTFSSYDESFGLLLASDMKWESFEKLGYLGNGYDWARMLSNYLKEVEPDLLNDLSFDPEADMFSASAINVEPLKRISELVSKFYDDSEMLEKHIEKYAKYE